MFAIDGDFTPPCASDPELFFSTRKDDIERAKQHCIHDCRIQLICLEQALDYARLSGEHQDGIIAGLTKAERENVKLTRIA